MICFHCHLYEKRRYYITAQYEETETETETFNSNGWRLCNWKPIRTTLFSKS